MDEIERKFLLDTPPTVIEQRAPARIRQGYLAISGDTEVRVRSRGDERVLTVKRGQGLVRREVSVPLTVGQFEDLWPLTVGRRVSKRRWVIPHGAVDLEIDVFDDDLDGLVMVEVEFASERASAEFVAPEWFGREVTDDSRYRNATLAVEGLTRGSAG